MKMSETKIQIIHEGSGEWYHGWKNPLAHEWLFNFHNPDECICRVCHKHLILIKTNQCDEVHDY